MTILKIEIDCDGSCCGFCRYSSGDDCGLYEINDLEWDEKREDLRRCTECLNAEVKE